jgi:hypothetical protein
MKLASYFFLSTLLWTNWDSFPLSHSFLAQATPGSIVPRHSSLEALIDKADACSQSYYREFRQFVAEERQIQKRYDRKGILAEQRTIVSDYYVVNLPSNPREAIEFREAISVDGNLIPRDPSRLSRLFNQRSSDLESEIRRINKESYKYYIANKGLGDLVNTWYKYASPECRDHTSYRLLRAEGPEEASATLLQFEELGPKTLIHFKDLFGRSTPIPASGSYQLAGADGYLVKVDITIFWAAERSYKIGRWIKEYKPGPEGIMLPSCFRTALYQGRSGKTFLETESTYSNFRRFTTDVKLTTTDLVGTSE